MKSFSLLLISFFASAAFAVGDTGQITMSTPSNSQSDLMTNNTSEAGFRYSSINDGTPFASVGLFHEFENGFAMGARGYLPVQFNNQAQAYMGEGVARFILFNSQDVIFIDGTLAVGFFNGKDDGQSFYTLGTGVGYQRQINDQFGAGGVIGVDYSDKRIAQGEIATQRTLYSKIGLFGVYYF